MKTKKIKKTQVEIPLEAEFQEDNEQLLEKAAEAVVNDLPERKKKKYQRSYDDRPENLRKPASQMSKEEKIQFKKWELAQLSGEDEIKEEIYTEDDLIEVGSMLLNFVNDRLPKPKPVTDIEVEKFAKIHTPLANKYFAVGGEWKNEINAGIFWVFFFIGRIKTQETIPEGFENLPNPHD
jgi:hypothetical protein